ncbi:MAG: carbon storage regulator [Planctomycetaceae bacterium]
MHLISRSIHQSVVIDDDIHVTILEIKEDQVTLEIHSPNSSVPYQIQTLSLYRAEESESNLVEEESHSLALANS